LKKTSFSKGFLKQEKNMRRKQALTAGLYALVVISACAGESISVVLTPTNPWVPSPTTQVNPTTVQPSLIAESEKENELPEGKLRVFDAFVQDVKTGEADKVTGMWVEDVLALRVIYQPPEDPAFVSTIEDVATYFLYPWEKAGNHGLLAHNYLAGRYFFNIGQGQIITLVFGDGYYQDFEVTQIKEFQALQPDSPYSDFIDLQTGEQLTVNSVFVEVYMGDFHTTLQTCIASSGETEWGRHFVLAPPL